MNLLTLRSAGDYGKVVAAVLTGGRRRSPRDQATRDIGLTTICLNKITSGMPLGLGRNLNPAIGAVEALQLIAGVSRPEVVLAVAPQFEAYMDRDDMHPERRYFHGAYGARVGFQVMCAVDKLKKDPDTRQAVITLWDPYQDNLPGKHDYPCTVMLSFSMKAGALELDTVMRSNDVWLGLPYDLFQFTQLQLTVATALGVRTGDYRHTALSLHLYERDLAAAQAFLANAHTRSYETKYQPQGIGSDGMTYQEIMHRAMSILDGTLPPSRTTRSEEWYHVIMRDARRRNDAT